MDKRKTWSDKQLEQLDKLFPTTENEVLARKFNKTVRSISSKATSRGLKKSARYWSKKDTEYLLKWVDHKTFQDLADELNKTRWGVINKYRELIGKR